ncbi:MAG TPA: TlpA disulfide reductase family protein [Dyella sp.]|uniref:TlpA disulfide reductase family protein n=1 Tax=Dyella sp. TaxID=1869338 RepID=UPI002F952C4F
MLSRSNTFILIAALLVAVAGGWMQRANQERRAPEGVVARPGEVRPDLILTDIDGKPHALSSFRARRVLLNFWASWCGPCLDEMPALARIQEKFGEKELIVVGIAMDDPAQVRSFLAQHPVPYPILMGQLESPSTSLRLGDTGEVLPFSVLLDADGRILATRRGALPDAQLADWLR